MFIAFCALSMHRLDYGALSKTTDRLRNETLLSSRKSRVSSYQLGAQTAKLRFLAPPAAVLSKQEPVACSGVHPLFFGLPNQ